MSAVVCSGVTLKNVRCKKHVKDGLYCNYHKNQDPQNNQQPVHPPVITDNTNVERCEGQTVRNTRCLNRGTLRASTGGMFCSHHLPSSDVSVPTQPQPNINRPIEPVQQPQILNNQNEEVDEDSSDDEDEITVNNLILFRQISRTQPEEVKKREKNKESEEKNPFKTNDEELIYLMKANKYRVSIAGTKQEFKQRVDEAIRRKGEPYVNIIGEEKLIAKGIYAVYGEEINGKIMGERELQIEKQHYDIMPKFVFSRVIKGYPVPYYKDLNIMKVCSNTYHTDVVTSTELSEYASDEKEKFLIYVDNERRGYYLPSILSIWESSFTYYDYISKRIMPSYPKDIHGEFMKPQVVMNVIATAIQRKIKISDYPILNLLYTNSDFLQDVYNFILLYKEITTKYDKISQKYPDDLGTWNRRDLLAYSIVKNILKYHDLPFYGARKFTNISSQAGEQGTQIFYQALFLSFFKSNDYHIRFSRADEDNIPLNLKWVYDKNGKCDKLCIIDSGNCTFIDLTRELIKCSLPI